MNPKIIKAIINEAKTEIAAIAAEAAAKTTIAEWDKRWKAKQIELYNKRLWNTRILLKHYRSLKKYCENAIYDKETAKNVENPIAILDAPTIREESMYIDSIKSSVARTCIIMEHVNKMLQIYQIQCQISDKPEEHRRYRVLDSYHIADKKIKMEAICKHENIDRSTFYRDINETSEALTALIFGVDGLSMMRQT